VSKSNVGRLKCNIDASFLKQTIVGIEICIRDKMSNFLLAKTEWFEPIWEVHVG